MKMVQNFLLISIVGFLLSCSSNSSQEEDTLAFEDTTTTPEENTAPTPTTVEDYSYYFDFDKYTLTTEAQQKLDEQLATLKTQLSNDPTLKIRLEGNADERGTREYNLSLGQRRADTVAKYLKTNGIETARMTTMSYGKERPLYTGHDEDSWSKNRRTDIKFYK